MIKAFWGVVAGITVYIFALFIYSILYQGMAESSYGVPPVPKIILDLLGILASYIGGAMAGGVALRIGKNLIPLFIVCVLVAALHILMICGTLDDHSAILYFIASGFFGCLGVLGPFLLFKRQNANFFTDDNSD